VHLSNFVAVEKQ